MSTYSASARANVNVDDSFSYLSDIENLPDYFPRMTSARRTTGDAVEVTAQIDPPEGPTHEVHGEAWFRVDESARMLSWGSEGPNNYSGELDLTPDGDDACTVAVRIQTENVEEERVQRGLRDAVDRVAKALEARSA